MHNKKCSIKSTTSHWKSFEPEPNFRELKKILKSDFCYQNSFCDVFDSFTTVPCQNTKKKILRIFLVINSLQLGPDLNPLTQNVIIKKFLRQISVKDFSKIFPMFYIYQKNFHFDRKISKKVFWTIWKFTHFVFLINFNILSVFHVLNKVFPTDRIANIFFKM